MTRRHTPLSPGAPVPALTVTQPWASLLSFGAVHVLSASNSIEHRGFVAIHAGSRRSHGGKFILHARAARMVGRITPAQEMAVRTRDVPFGAVVATAHLEDVVATDEVLWSTDLDRPHRYIVERSGVDHIGHWVISNRERSLLASAPFLLLFARVRPLPRPVPTRGHPGLWNWVPPPDLAVTSSLDRP